MTDYPNNIPAKLEIIKASEITPKEVRWLWYPYIPFGKVTLLQGDPGDGKSKLMLSLAALLSKGAPLPFDDEDEQGEPMTIIYQTTEDDADDTVVPRFNSAGGDGERLIFIKEDEKSLTFGDDRIREAVEKYNARSARNGRTEPPPEKNNPNTVGAEMIGKDNPFHYYPDFLTSSTLELRRYENERHYKHDYQAPRRPRRERQRLHKGS